MSDSDAPVLLTVVAVVAAVVAVFAVVIEIAVVVVVVLLVEAVFWRGGVLVMVGWPPSMKESGPSSCPVAGRAIWCYR